MGSKTKGRGDGFVIAASVNRVGQIDTTYAELMYIMERLFCFLHDQPTKKRDLFTPTPPHPSTHHVPLLQVPSLPEILPVQ